MQVIRNAFAFVALLVLSATAPCAYALDIPGDPPPSAEIPGRFVIARRGVPPPCAISLDADASEAERYAAAELRDFTARMTGVTLPIGEPAAGQRAIVLSKSAKDLPIEAFRLTADGDRLLVEASGGNGILYGVYELLERHGGCRWYSSWCERVPELEVFSVPDDLADEQRPAFKLREPYWRDVKMNPDFSCRNRINGSLHMKLEAKHGGMPYTSGTGPLHFCHTFTKLCPPSLYFYEHPEYFSEVNGKRLKERTQLCLTNPDVLRIVTSNVLANIRKDPGRTFYGVSQNDNGNYCTCAKCREVDEREGSHFGTTAAFVNKVAEAVEKEFPGVKIETLAYQHSRTPPKRTRLRANVLPCVCTMEIDNAHAVGQSRYWENVALADNLKAWGGICDEIFIYGYGVNFNHYTAPFPGELAYQDTLRFYRDHKVRYIFMQGACEGLHTDFAELKAWLLAKWMWNPDLPREELLQDFFSGFYGKAAPYVRTYFDALNSFYHDPQTLLHLYEKTWNSVVPLEFFERAQKLWDLAEKAVADEPETIRRNVRIARFSVHYAEFMRLTDGWPRKAWAARDTAPYAAKARRIRELARTMLDIQKEAGGIKVAESGRKIKERQALMRAWAAGEIAVPEAADSAILEEAALAEGPFAKSAEIVDDPLAGDGRALRLAATNSVWAATFDLDGIAFDRDAKYRLLLRVRPEAAASAPSCAGAPFWAAIYDSETRSYPCDVKTIAGGDGGEGVGYRWIEAASWRPGKLDRLQVGIGGSGAIHLDCIRIEHVDAATPSAPSQAADDPHASGQSAGTGYALTLDGCPAFFAEFTIPAGFRLEKSGEDAWRIAPESGDAGGAIREIRLDPKLRLDGPKGRIRAGHPRKADYAEGGWTRKSPQATIIVFDPSGRDRIWWDDLVGMGPLTLVFDEAGEWRIRFVDINGPKEATIAVPVGFTMTVR